MLAPELLELVSLMLVHRFHSEEWFTYLKSKVPLPPGGFEMIRELATGQALVFAASQRLMPASELASTPLLVSVRARFTQDLGASVTNSGCPRAAAAAAEAACSSMPARQQHYIAKTDDARFTQDLGASGTTSGCLRPPSTRISTVAAAVATKIGGAPSRSTPITASALGSPPPQPSPPQAPSTAVTTAAAQRAAKMQSILMSKEEEWLSQIVKSLRNKGGSPVEIGGLVNAAQGGVVRPAGVAKSIKLHDLISTHPHRGLVVTKRGKTVLVSLA